MHLHFSVKLLRLVKNNNEKGAAMFKSLLTITVFFLFTAGFAYAVDQFGTTPVSPINPDITDTPQNLPTRARDSRPAARTETNNTAGSEIESKLEELLSNVNEAKEPNMAELNIADTVKKNMPNLQRLDAETQSNLQLLNAWMFYFSSDTKRAKIAANAAYRSEPKNKDAQNTYVLMCIANNDSKTAKTVIAAIRRNAAKPETARNAQQRTTASEGQTRAILNFDANSVKTELLDKSTGFWDVACLNGTLLPYKEGKTLFAMLWASSPSTEEQQPRARDRQSPGLDFFASIFAENFANPNAGFLGLNLDPESRKNAVMETLMKNAWPWPQAMAQDSRNSALAEFASLRSDEPSLAILGSDGKIRYAGAFSNIVLWMVSRSFQLSCKLLKLNKWKPPKNQMRLNLKRLLMRKMATSPLCKNSRK